ncbi:hypothetical protein GTA62_14520 [Roseobacter sp. HKCCD9010]|uniref:HU family DNA-binding protein n=1 Tax=unclassified Roseobacter TaxID=196798 RepID=UPI001492794C|nr:MULTISPECIES: HU family DNA-binding protein [unclassified Roseobacter]MBF9050674.1 hypothetical protein [Rhodobacterales bacterium HKCCD4356]NNV11908.1 hypothetical protein [Roseobacter sp. HKCCD7357]NNV16921.1 hypothetical protein [Roseobacter sp. HKCCD8768]NNV26150.1 hypothetical protein [Roseobacter sp. HKCCD8192]NNV30642.1 hypothetical protein [Roseobacter sp. HKCCD9061]
MATTTKPRKSTPAGRRSRKSTSTSKPATTEVASDKLEDAMTPVKKGGAAAAKAAVPAKDSAVDAAAGKIKRGDLLDAVAARCALKRSDLRIAVELVLDELGTALDSGKDLVIPPLGKVVVKRRNEAKNGDVLITRIKRHKRGSEGLAEPDEDS